MCNLLLLCGGRLPGLTARLTRLRMQQHRGAASCSNLRRCMTTQAPAKSTTKLPLQLILVCRCATACGSCFCLLSLCFSAVVTHSWSANFCLLFLQANWSLLQPLYTFFFCCLRFIRGYMGCSRRQGVLADRAAAGRRRSCECGQVWAGFHLCLVHAAGAARDFIACRNHFTASWVCPCGP